MPVPFEAAIQQANSSVGTIASLVWNPGNTSATTFGALGSITAGNVLKDVMVVNQGTVPVYLGSGSAAVATTTGLICPVGGFVVIGGYNVTAGTTTAGQIWGQTGTVGATGAVVAGLTTIAGGGVI